MRKGHRLQLLKCLEKEKIQNIRRNDQERDTKVVLTLRLFEGVKSNGIEQQFLQSENLFCCMSNEY